MVGIQLQLATGMHIMHVPPGQLKDSRARPSCWSKISWGYWLNSYVVLPETAG